VARYFERRGYRLLASPTIYPGQTLSARVVASAENDRPLQVSLYIKHYNASDELTAVHGESVSVAPGQDAVIAWRVPDTHCYPIAFVGVEVQASGGQCGTLFLDYLTWEGTPDVVLDRPLEREQSRLTMASGPSMWKLAWIDGSDSRERLADLDYWPEPYRLIQNKGRGLLMQGTREWTDYQVTVRMTPHMCQAGGIAVRVQGMSRYYALLIDQDKTRLVRAFEGRDAVLAEAALGWTWGQTYELNLKAQGNRLIASLNGQVILTAEDSEGFYTGGGIALIAEVGRIGCEHVEVRPL
jgi:hypothetical protein